MNKYTHSLPLLHAFIFLLIVLLTQHANAITVIRANIEINGIVNPVDIGLFESQTPGTVSNFKSYINDGDFVNSLIYRNVPGFVIQTGGFTFDDTLNDGRFIYDNDLDQYDGGLQAVTSKGNINHEFKLANSRGSIAMARIPGQPNSATSEWFVNLEDNTEKLDILTFSLDPGFTVFGKVLGNGIEVFDQIADMDTFNFSTYHGAFKDFPTTNNYTLSDQSPEDLVKNNLIIISSFSEIYQITTFVNFGDVLSGETVTKDIIISNTANTPLELGLINTNNITTPFSIISNPCENATLDQGEQCIIQVRFTMPATPGYFNDQFDIEVISENKTFTAYLTNNAPDIDVSRKSIEFGFVPVFDPVQDVAKRIFPLLFNRGDKELEVFSITLDGVDQSEFELFDNCTTDNNPFQPGKVLPSGFCTFGIHFKPTSLAEKFATVTIISDDPDTAELIIQVHGGASSDTDGVSPDIEDASTNAGDGNNDDIPDKLQSNVASFLNTDNSYTTLVTDDSAQFSNITPVQLSTLDTLPDNIILAKGVFSFELVDIPVGSTAEFGMILPSGNSPASIYSYGPTSDNNTPHWYALENDTVPGVIMFGNVSLQDKSNSSSIDRNITTVRILDGGTGDSDQQANGIIVFVGGPEINNQRSSSSGALLWLLFLIPFSILVYRR